MGVFVLEKVGFFSKKNTSHPIFNGIALIPNYTPNYNAISD